VHYDKADKIIGLNDKGLLVLANYDKRPIKVKSKIVDEEFKNINDKADQRGFKCGASAKPQIVALQANRDSYIQIRIHMDKVYGNNG
jgi:hypothetical protein